MWNDNVFSRIWPSVCVYVSDALTFEGCDLESSFCYAATSSEYLGQFIYQGHRVRVKVKVTGAKKASLCALFRLQNLNALIFACRYRYIFRTSRISLYIKVIGSRSRSKSHKQKKRVCVSRSQLVWLRLKGNLVSFVCSQINTEPDMLQHSRCGRLITEHIFVPVSILHTCHLSAD